MDNFVDYVVDYTVGYTDHYTWWIINRQPCESDPSRKLRLIHWLNLMTRYCDLTMKVYTWWNTLGALEYTSVEYTSVEYTLVGVYLGEVHLGGVSSVEYPLWSIEKG